MEDVFKGPGGQAEVGLGPLALGLGSVALGVGLQAGSFCPQIADRGDHGHRHQERQRGAGQGRQRPVAATPSPCPAHRRDATGANRPVLKEAAEVGGQLAGRLIAMGRIAGHRLHHYGFQIAGDGRIELARVGRLLVRHLVDQAMAVLLVECRPQRQQFVQRQAEVVDVAAGVGLPGELLGGHVAKRPHHVAGMGQVVRVAQLRQPEVGNPYRAAIVQQQVGRLDVAVQGPLPVGVFQGVGHLNADPRHAPPVAMTGIVRRRRRLCWPRGIRR